MNGPLPTMLEPLYLPAGWQSLVERPAWLAAVLGCWLLAILATLWFSWRERHALRSRRWIPLGLLRGIALTAIAVGIIGIERREVTERVDPSRVVLLVDSSSSMRLPSEQEGQSVSRSDAAIELASQLVEPLSVVHEVHVARFGQSVKYREDQPPSSLDPKFFDPSANATRLGDALRIVLEEQAGAPLAAIVVLSDGQSTAGVDPLAVAAQAAERPTLIHTVGWGPLSETPRVELAGLSVPKRVFSGDRFSTTALLLSRGGYEGSATVRLTISPEQDETKIIEEQTTQVDVTPQSTTPVAKFELPAPPPGRYTVRLSLADVSAPVLTAQLESVDRKTNVLLIAGGPTRDFRFLRDQLHRDDSFTVHLLLQSAMGAVSQDADRLLDSFPLEAPLEAESLNAYDAIVAFDPDWQSLGEGADEMLEKWVSRQSGGLLLVPGVVHTPASLRQTNRSPLTRLSPVTLADDLLFTGLGLSASATPSPVRLTPAGESADFMRWDSAGDAAAAWARLDGFYGSPLPAKPKTGGTVYAHLGEGAGTTALLVEQFYGSGRVAYLATGETWRLRREDPRWFTSFHTKLLRHLSQGRLLGNSQGRLFFDQDRYEVGETVRLRLTLAEGTAIVGPPSVRLRQLVDKDTELVSKNRGLEELALTPIEGQPGSYICEWPSRREGNYEASTLLEGETEITATALIELPHRETAHTLRDETTLRGIAEATGGTYYASFKEALSLPEATPSRAETRTLLGPADQEFGRSLARGLLLTAIIALTIEWTLRRLWRLA